MIEEIIKKWNIWFTLAGISCCGTIIFLRVWDLLNYDIKINLLLYGILISFGTTIIYLSYGLIELYNPKVKIYTKLEKRIPEKEFNLEKPKGQWDK